MFSSLFILYQLLTINKPIWWFYNRSASNVSFVAVEEAIQEEFENNNNNNHSAFHHQKQAFLPNTTSSAETPPSEQKLKNNGPSSLMYEPPSAHSSNPRWRPQQLMQQPRGGKNTWFDDKVREFLDSCELDTICQESNVYRVKSKVIFFISASVA